MGEEVSEFLGRGRSRVDQQPGYRNGYGKPRRLTLGSGTVELRPGSAYSVETGSSRPSRAAFNVCQDSVAHLMRTGNCLTPERISRSPSNS